MNFEKIFSNSLDRLPILALEFSSRFNLATHCCVIEIWVSSVNCLNFFKILYKVFILLFLQYWQVYVVVVVIVVFDHNRRDRVQSMIHTLGCTVNTALLKWADMCPSWPG